MSNVIKAYTVRYDVVEKKTIDTHLKIDREIVNRSSLAVAAQPQALQEGFVEGLKAMVVEEVNPQQEENAGRLIEDARQEAGRILEQAAREAEKIKKDAYSAAQKNGYDAGIAQARQEIQKIKAGYEEKAGNLKQEYDSMVEKLEPQLVTLVADLVERITGILVEDKREVILYLLERALKNMEKSNEYTIRVSKEDYEVVTAGRTLLQSALGWDALLYIQEDSNLGKNQGYIETDLKIINCSLDIQLHNLITDLKLMSVK